MARPASCILGGWALRVGDAAGSEPDGVGASAVGALTIKHGALRIFKDFQDSKTLDFLDQQLDVAECYLILEKSTINQGVGFREGRQKTMSSPPNMRDVCCKISLQPSLSHKSLKSVSSWTKSTLRTFRCPGCAEGPSAPNLCLMKCHVLNAIHAIHAFIRLPSSSRILASATAHYMQGSE